MKKLILTSLITTALTACGGSDSSKPETPIVPEPEVPVVSFKCTNPAPKGFEASCVVEGFDVVEFNIDDTYQGVVKDSRVEENTFYFTPTKGERIQVWAMETSTTGYVEVVSFSGEDITEPDQGVTSGKVILKSLNINKYKAIGTTAVTRQRSAGHTPTISVGITNDNTVEPVEPEYGILHVEGEEQDLSPICTEPAPIKIERINDIGGDWSLALVSVPDIIRDCEVLSYAQRHFISHPELGAFEYPEGYTPEYANQPSNNAVVPYLIKANGSRNAGDNPLVIASTNGGGSTDRNMFELILPNTKSDVPQLKMLVPNYNPNFWSEDTWALKHEGHVYYIAEGNLVNKVNLDSGRIVNSWTSEYVDTPFVFKGKLYMAVSGDKHVELLDDGKLGDVLSIPTDPNVFHNAYAVKFVVDDRYIIGDRCNVWDMEAWSTIAPQNTGGHGDMQLKDGVLFCAGENYPTYIDGDMSQRFGGSSVRLGEVVVLQQQLHPMVKEIQESLKLQAPFINYQFSGHNVYETDTITFNLITGEEVIETHYFDGEKLVDFTPVN